MRWHRANSGIGFDAAAKLAAKGHTVTLARLLPVTLL